MGKKRESLDERLPRRATIENWKGRAIPAARTSGNVVFVEDYRDNLITTGTNPWPPAPIVQKLYGSDHVNRFPRGIKQRAERQLRFYTDLQSLHSEDAITWSFFGPLMRASATRRVSFLSWLLARSKLDWEPGQRVEIDLWRRIAHPEKPSSSGGPELDFVIQSERVVVFGEAKWLAKEARNQGVKRNRTQSELRREYLEKFGRRIYGDRRMLMLGLVLDRPLEEEIRKSTRGVATRSVFWAELCLSQGRPHLPEFRRYLRWKLSHIAEAGRKSAAEAVCERFGI